MGVLGSIFGFGDALKRRLKDAGSNPRDFTEMAVDQNQNEWRKNPDERSMGFFNPVPLGTMGKFVMDSQAQKIVDQLSRRDFLKKSAGLGAGAAVGSKLLAKFAPEERAIAKQAAIKQGVAETAPKYKYNSLKDYLDDVSLRADDKANLFAFQVQGDARHVKPVYMKRLLLEDEAEHEAAKFFYKDNLKDPTTGKWINPYDGQPHSEEFLKNIRNTTDDFSPQAKKEMKEYKDWAGRQWVNTGDELNISSANVRPDAWSNPDKLQGYLDIPF